MKKTILIFLLLIICIPAYTKKISFDNDWAVFMRDKTEKVALIMVNIALGEKHQIINLPQINTITLSYRESDENGLLLKTKFPKLYKLEEKLEKKLSSKLEIIYIGRIISNKKVILYYYSTETNKFDKIVKKELNKQKDFKYRIKSEMDRKWSIFFDSLFPTEVEMERIQNARLINVFLENGDILYKEREVTYWFYFRNKNEMSKFSKEISLKSNFVIEKSEESVNKSTDEYKYQLILHLNHNIDLNKINRITDTFMSFLKNFDGKYDGWESFIIKE